MNNNSEIIFKLITNLEERLEHINKKCFYDDDFMRISCAILKVVYRNLDERGRVNLECIENIDENIEICRKTFFDKICGGEESTYAIANQLPIFLVNMIVNEGVGAIAKDDFKPMIKHPKSGVRLCAFRTLWLVRDRLDNKGIIQGLLYNLDENLGYISEAAGLLRGIVGDDERFFEAAKKYERFVKRGEQYFQRISQIKDEKLLPACMQLLIDFENEISELTR